MCKRSRKHFPSSEKPDDGALDNKDWKNEGGGLKGCSWALWLKKQRVSDIVSKSILLYWSLDGILHPCTLPLGLGTA